MGRSLIDSTRTCCGTTTTPSTSSSSIPPTTRSTGREVYPRKPPQIGASFQLRALPERMDTYTTIRSSRPPLLLSTDYPHRTVAELHVLRDDTTNCCASVSDATANTTSIATTTTTAAAAASLIQPTPLANTPQNNSNPVAVLGYESTTSIGPQRRTGGTQLHRRVESTTTFTSGWFSPSSSSTTTPTVWEWSLALRQWHAHATDTTRRSRGTTQRKPTVPASLWLLLASHSNSSMTNNTPAFWHYAYERHGGHAAAASLALLAAWGAGHQADRCGKEDANTCWRDVVQHRLCRLSGAFVDAEERCSTGSPAATDWDTDVLQGTWESVLHCASLLLQQQSSSTRLLLSSVTQFLAYAAQLPEATTDASLTRHVNTTMGALVAHVVTARSERAHVLDLWSPQKGGIDVEVLRKQVDKLSNSSRRLLLVPDELEEMQRQIRYVTAWQQRLERVYAHCSTTTTQDRDDLTVLEGLWREAQQHGFVAKSAALLHVKLEKAYSIRKRIHDVTWDDASGSGGTTTSRSATTTTTNSSSTTTKPALKTIASIVRDIHRLKIRFPAVNSMLALQQRIETWVDRATIASRSRLSLEEVSELIATGRAMPVDLSDPLAKLALRVEAATEWIARFHEVIQYDGGDRWTVIDHIRAILENEEIYRLQDLATEGSRMPVEVEKIQLLQVELDAYAWSVKMTKWIGNSGKLSELREHRERATSLRDRLLVEDKTRWTLKGEEELTAILTAADLWLSEAEQILSKKQCVSIQQFNKIQQQGNAIDTSLGAPMSKMAKIVAQADKWLENHHALVVKLQSKGEVDRADIANAVSAAAEVGTNFSEAVELNDLLGDVDRWLKLCNVAMGEMSGDPLTLEQVESLIKESTSLPIDARTQCTVLEQKRSQVQQWQQGICERIEAFLLRLEFMQQGLTKKYGDPIGLTWAVLEANHYNPNNSPPDSLENAESSMCVRDLCPTLGAQVIQDMLNGIRDEAASFSIKTPEARAFEDSFNMLRWIFQSIGHMHNQRFIFDKRFFGAFDRFVKEPKSIDCGQYNTELLSRVIRYSAVLVKDQAHRLQSLLSLRQRYVKICKQAQQVLSTEKPSIDKLSEVSKASSVFPTLDDPLKLLNSRLAEAMEWTAEVKRTLEDSGKISQGEAHAFLIQADSIGFVCQEASLLRNGVKAAKNWVRRARKYCKEEKLDPTKVESLIKEYEPLIIEMPEDFDKLKKSCMKYCICRRVYSGFMICCDECQDWFHGPCVGLTESCVKKKYICVRCGFRKAYNSSTGSIANTVRKWSSLKEIQKVRDNDEKKIANKVTKQSDAIEELEIERAAIEVKLRETAKEACAVVQEHKVPSEAMDVDDIAMNEAVTSAFDAASSGAPNHAIPIVHEEVLGTVGDGTNNGTASGDELSVALNVIQHKLENCATKLQKITAQRDTLIKRYKSEDVRFIDLKHWFLKIRSLIMAPPSEEVALASRPNADGSLSSVMVALQNEAKTTGLYKFSDVKAVMNQIQCLAFCLRAATIFARKPTSTELESLVKQGVNISGVSHLLIPVRTLKGFLGRYKTWESAVFDELTPVPSLTTAFNEANLHGLAEQADRMPFRTTLRDRIATVLEDNARRHCLCGGPSDGRFMIGCDGCDNWFHGHCVGVNKKTPEAELSPWLCPQCANAPLQQIDVVNFHSQYDVSDEESEADQDESSPLTPRPDDLWPPLGLLYSARAIKALGADCCAVPDNSQIRALAETSALEFAFAPMEGALPPGSQLVLKPEAKSHDNEVVPPATVSSAEAAQPVLSAEPEAPLSIQLLSLKRPASEDDDAVASKKQRTVSSTTDQP